MTLKNNKTHTYLYKTSADWGCPLSDVISSDKMAIEVFEPKTDLIGIHKNYILDIPDSEIQSEYDTGNVHAHILQAKTLLDVTYSMDLSSPTTINNTREYCGIATCGNKIYLKFRDDVNYRESEKKKNDNDITEVAVERGQGSQYTYQKVEFLTKNKFTNKQNHKSNLFSINIDDLTEMNENRGDDVQTQGDDKFSEVVSQLRNEIQSAVKEIVSNVTPANTQLFKVFFGM